MNPMNSNPNYILENIILDHDLNFKTDKDLLQKYCITIFKEKKAYNKKEKPGYQLYWKYSLIGSLLNLKNYLTELSDLNSESLEIQSLLSRAQLF